jgi:hypothetical protein
MKQAHLQPAPDRIEAESFEQAIELFFDKEWTDGLPIVPPTDERVRAMLAGAPDRDPEEVIGTVPPRWAEATVRICAVNAVMAGCLPQYMPVLLAVVEAAVDPAFNLGGIQATTPMSPRRSSSSAARPAPRSASTPATTSSARAFALTPR